MTVVTYDIEDIESIDSLNDVDNTNKANGRVLVYRSASGNLEYEDQSGGGGGGYTPQIFYAQGNSTSNLGTGLGTLTWDTPVYKDSGYSESGGTITIGSALNGKRARVDWNILCSGGTNRVELEVELQVNSSTVTRMNNYSARNSSQDEGGMAGYHYLTLSTNMTIRVQALRIGSTANLVTTGTSFAIETKS